VLKALIKEAKINNLELNPERIMTDFELAATNSFRKNFPGILSKGCLFHFGNDATEIDNIMARLVLGINIIEIYNIIWS
jgi:hypothetical protein